MARRCYYTLTASLPRLVYFERAERAPITQPRLEQRLRMLDAADATELGLARPLVQWRVDPAMGTDAQTVGRYRAVMQSARSPAVRRAVDMRTDMRTVLTGLRRRLLGEGVPTQDEAWGAGRWVPWIRRHWDAPDFGLEGVCRWVPEARSMMESADAMGLQRLLMGIAWRFLSRIGDEDSFGFATVVAFVCKWDIVDRWVSCDADAAKDRFQELVTEVIGEHNEPFR